MAKLFRVTITGADDSVSPDQLASLSYDFPFVEWGILVSAKHEGRPRYPSRKWRDRLCDWHGQNGFRVAIHTQGEWLRALMAGNEEPLIDGVGPLLKMARRIQLNFHGEQLAFNVQKFVVALTLLPRIESKTLLFQHDNSCGEKAMREVLAVRPQLDCLPFYDLSHGTGVPPKKWPRATGRTIAMNDVCQVGYAGGLGPDNLHSQIPLIAKAAGDLRFWIDMETKVRSSHPLDYANTDFFDLERVRKCLEICKPFVTISQP